MVTKGWAVSCPTHQPGLNASPVPEPWPAARAVRRVKVPSQPRPTALETTTGWGRGTPTPGRLLKGNRASPPPPPLRTETHNHQYGLGTFKQKKKKQKNILLASYVQYSDFKHKILSIITGKPILTGKHISMLPGPLLSTLALCQVSSATRRDGRRGSQMTGHSHSPHTSRTHLHNPLQMVSGQAPSIGGPEDSYSPASLQETISIKLLFPFNSS